MKRKLGHYMDKKNLEILTEMDFHDFIDMVQSGLSDEEIASELGVSKRYIEKYKNEIQNDF